MWFVEGQEKPFSSAKNYNGQRSRTPSSSYNELNQDEVKERLQLLKSKLPPRYPSADLARRKRRMKFQEIQERKQNQEKQNLTENPNNEAHPDLSLLMGAIHLKQNKHAFTENFPVFKNEETLSTSSEQTSSSTTDYRDKSLSQLASEESKNMDKMYHSACDSLYLSEDWKEQAKGLETISEIAFTNSNFIVPKLSSILPKILEYVNSLRSALSKTAIVCIKDLFKSCKKSMDFHLESISKLLLKKMTETSKFISEQAEAAMKEMVHNVTDTKAMSCLLACSNNRNSAIRAKAAMFVYEASQIMGERVLYQKDLNKYLNSIYSILNEGSIESRRWGKALVSHLYKLFGDMDRLEHFLHKHLKDETKVNKFKEALRKVSSASVLPRKGKTVPTTNHARSVSLGPWAPGGNRTKDKNRAITTKF
eukprot:gb/GECH01006710.1/.p1 GENE.gb/GECH01006710.1/~~gb/GECH01006710.1/.p1  ORF type:complete len:422 (+),score=93.21 gb/GECH01006710.1/:1-1266(+)